MGQTTKICTLCGLSFGIGSFHKNRRALEKLFTVGMTWKNYGTVWEIDHKIPVAIFNFEKPEHIDFRLCWNLKNLQPLEKEKNRAKSAKIEEPFQPSFAFG